MMDEANLLCDRLERLIDDARSLLQDGAGKEKLVQLREVRATVEALSNKGVEVPEPILRLRDTLAEDDVAVQAAASTLKTISSRLADVATKMNTLATSTPASRTVQSIRAPRKNAILAGDYEELIIHALRRLGGRAAKGEVLPELLNALGTSSSGSDSLQRSSTVSFSWDALARARKALVDRGILRSDSPRGIWELADDTNADND
jgi:hypothetical protein